MKAIKGNKSSTELLQYHDELKDIVQRMYKTLADRRTHVERLDVLVARMRRLNALSQASIVVMSGNNQEIKTDLHPEIVVDFSKEFERLDREFIDALGKHTSVTDRDLDVETLLKLTTTQLQDKKPTESDPMVRNNLLVDHDEEEEEEDEDEELVEAEDSDPF